MPGHRGGLAMIELRWLLPADNGGCAELRRLQEVASKLTPPGNIEPRPHGQFIAVHAWVTTPEDIAKLALVMDDFPKGSDDRGGQVLDRMQTYWFRCDIPEDKRQ